MRKQGIAVLVVASLLISGVAMAKDVSTATAEAASGDGGATIELANAHWREGRFADAYRAYRRALAQDNVMLETRQGDAVWSHDVARRVLAHQVALSVR